MTAGNGQPVFRMLGPDKELLGEVPLPELRLICIGRGEDNDIVVRDPTVSRHHATVTRSPEGYSLVDSGSSNGTWFNDNRIKKRLLNHGDRLRIGSTTLVFLNKKRSLVELLSPGSGRARSTPSSSERQRDEHYVSIGSGDTPVLSVKLTTQRHTSAGTWCLAIGLGIGLAALIIVSLVLMR